MVFLSTLNALRTIGEQSSASSSTSPTHRNCRGSGGLTTSSTKSEDSLESSTSIVSTGSTTSLTSSTLAAFGSRVGIAVGFSPCDLNLGLTKSSSRKWSLQIEAFLANSSTPQAAFHLSKLAKRVFAYTLANVSVLTPWAELSQPGKTQRVILRPGFPVLNSIRVRS
uniref:(northern house mosquito) hypothetical protein n=1 Tax=Culex pipiens TaxID=7175 RepID=A0A8D8AH05_CULPI